jgi:hypothetical protein
VVTLRSTDTGLTMHEMIAVATLLLILAVAGAETSAKAGQTAQLCRVSQLSVSDPAC